MKNILDVLYEYANKRQILDINAIEKIIRSYINEYDINIIKNVYIINKNEILYGKTILGKYLEDYIEIYYARLLCVLNDERYKTESIYEDKLDIYESIFRMNIFITSIICHELEHAIQEQMFLLNKPVSFEDKLIIEENNYLDHLGYKALKNCIYNEETGEYKLNFIEHMKYLIMYKLDNKRYMKNYDISLLERLADIDSLTKIYETISEIKNKVPNTYIILGDEIIERKLRDYDNCKISPTIDFFNNILGKNNNLFNYDNNSYTLDERLRLGFPISDDEYLDTLKLCK